MSSGKYHRETYIEIVNVENDFLKLFHQFQDFVGADYIQTRNRMDVYLTTYSSFIVTEDMRAAPDLISFSQYKTVDLWWVICLYNGIVNPMTEIVPGLELKIPNLSQIDIFLTALKRTGSARSTKAFVAQNKLIN